MDDALYGSLFEAVQSFHSLLLMFHLDSVGAPFAVTVIAVPAFTMIEGATVSQKNFCCKVTLQVTSPPLPEPANTPETEKPKADALGVSVCSMFFSADALDDE